MHDNLLLPAKLETDQSHAKQVIGRPGLYSYGHLLSFLGEQRLYIDGGDGTVYSTFPSIRIHRLPLLTVD